MRTVAFRDRGCEELFWSTARPKLSAGRFCRRECGPGGVDPGSAARNHAIARDHGAAICERIVCGERTCGRPGWRSQLVQFLIEKLVIVATAAEEQDGGTDSTNEAKKTQRFLHGEPPCSAYPHGLLRRAIAERRSSIGQ